MYGTNLGEWLTGRGEGSGLLISETDIIFDCPFIIHEKMLQLPEKTVNLFKVLESDCSVKQHYRNQNNAFNKVRNKFNYNGKPGGPKEICQFQQRFQEEKGYFILFNYYAEGLVWIENSILDRLVLSGKFLDVMGLGYGSARVKNPLNFRFPPSATHNATPWCPKINSETTVPIPD